MADDNSSSSSEETDPSPIPNPSLSVVSPDWRQGSHRSADAACLFSLEGCKTTTLELVFASFGEAFIIMCDAPEEIDELQSGLHAQTLSVKVQ
jgi:hypothetical protein